MDTLLVAVITFVGYIVAYNTYGRWLGRRIFRLDPDAPTPACQLNDGRDYVPTRRPIVFGHHFTSIAGTGPIVGPAIAVFWGWLPALLWVLLGSVFIGAVHDLGSLVVSLRNRGQTVGEIAGRMITPRARLLFLVILFVALMVVIAVFGLVIATIFASYPGSVFAIWVQIPIAVAVGLWVYRRGGDVFWPSMLALVLMYVTIWIGSYWLRIDLTQFGVPLSGKAALAAGRPAWFNAVLIWTALLLVYCFIASVLPVWVLLQPRDFINSNQLLVALALLFVGLMLVPLRGGSLPFVAPAVQKLPPEFGAPPIWPFLFITIACGAVSGFHCLVSSGTTSKQLARETDALMVGYGSMLLEGGLAVLVIIACTAGLGLGIYHYDPGAGRYVHQLDPQTQQPLLGAAAWAHYYSAAHWSDFKLSQKIGGFIEGGANMLAHVGVPVTLGISLMAVLVAAFAATTLDTATRLQRYVISELGAAIRLPTLQNRYVATTVAVVTGGALALIPGPAGPGSGGLILWPIFGATNQLLAGLSFLVIAFYLLRHRRPVWFLVPPMILMLILPNWAMLWQMRHWWVQQNWVLLVMGGVVIVLELWMIAEAALLWGRVRGVLPEPLPPLQPAPAVAAERRGPVC